MWGSISWSCQECYPDRTPHSKNVFSRLATCVRAEGAVQPHHNKEKQVIRSVRDMKSADILASIKVNPQDFVRKLEKGSETDLPDLLEYVPLQSRLNMRFQQDGCPAHTSRVARTQSDTRFTNKAIEKYDPINFPPRSPDLTVLDFICGKESKTWFILNIR
ncbi:hypothetical protein ILUMI_16276 [Ignelater luminosus]|uniref:Uncharacterized protein n=1 Tax=Ignelater luminosus TaxID=2038154 RepID=A0A8K0CT95_IGNLU|nr:hypothetical protein ILUMI_16276 [Ignelater luminosus]